VNEIVAAAGHDDQAEDVSRLFFQFLFYRLKMLQRVASRDGEIPRLEIGQNSGQVSAAHVLKFIVRIIR
jgi:hypothetical protein